MINYNCIWLNFPKLKLIPIQKNNIWIMNKLDAKNIYNKNILSKLQLFLSKIIQDIAIINISFEDWDIIIIIIILKQFQQHKLFLWIIKNKSEKEI